VCDETYGLSVGRGSFFFARGAWTHIKQTVHLNTPGQQDGGFRLEVNGKLAINRTDLLYRDIASTSTPTPTSGSAGPSPTTVKTPTTSSCGLLCILIRRISPRHTNVGYPWNAIRRSASATVIDPDRNQEQWAVEEQPIMTSKEVATQDPIPDLVGFKGIFFRYRYQLSYPTKYI
jgi:hypothetical protein